MNKVRSVLPIWQGILAGKSKQEAYLNQAASRLAGQRTGWAADRLGSGQAGSGQAGSGQAGSGQAGSGQTASGQTSQRTDQPADRPANGQTSQRTDQPADSTQGGSQPARRQRPAKSWICPSGTWPVSKDASGALPISWQFPVSVGLRPLPLPENISNRCGTWAVQIGSSVGSDGQGGAGPFGGADASAAREPRTAA